MALRTGMRWMVAGAAVLALGGCNRTAGSPLVVSDKLDAETAERILREKEFSTGKAECRWAAPNLKTATEWTYSPHIAVEEDCASELQAAGLAKKGDCQDPGCTGGCCSRFISATDKSRLSEKAEGLAFTCGEMKLIKVTSIITEGSKATVKYEREVTFDAPLLAKIPACKLEKPDVGTQERERVFLRDDAGKWALKGK